MREPTKQDLVHLLHLNKNGPQEREALRQKLHLGVLFNTQIDQLIAANWVVETPQGRLSITDDGKEAVKTRRRTP